MSDLPTEELARNLLASLQRMLDAMPEQSRARITGYRADIDRVAAALREGGFTPGQVGVLLADNLLHRDGVSREVAVALALATMR